ncbi:MAG: ABC transporter ATP-binding protein [Planctomycetaceae bacterium]
MNDAPIIDVEDLRKVYRDGWFGRREVHALHGATLQVHRGEIFGLLGPNGAGKTTLIKVLLGIVRKTAGQARILGQPAGDRQARKRIGYLPEHHRIPRHLTGDTALEYYGSLSGMALSDIKQRRPDLLRTVGLADWGKTSVAKYSKGMQQRLGLAQAMLHRPELMILDEPTDGVDPAGRADIRRILKEQKDAGKTVFVNSHLLHELELVCDRVAILNRGEVRRIGTVAELTQGPREGGGGTEQLLELEGAEAAVRSALAGQTTTTWQAIGPNQFRIGIPVQNQQQVDQVIDALRLGRVTILSMQRRRVTLAEAFIEIVQDDE